MTRDQANLLDMARAARLVMQFGEEVEDVDAFATNVLIQSAVLHQLMVLGEATSGFPASLSRSTPRSLGLILPAHGIG